MSAESSTQHEAGDAPGLSRTLRDFIDEAPLERRSIVEFVAAAAASTPAGARVGDIGAGGSPYRELFRHAEYVAIDRAQTLHAEADELDVVASADNLPLDDATFDALLCTQVLEHLANPREALAEMARVLKPGGRLFLTAPLAWEEHEMPHDYFRYTRSGLDHLLAEAGFHEIAIKPRTDCFTTLAQLVRSSRWSLGETGDPSELSQERLDAFRRLDELADELLELAPLDARHSFPLGFTAAAVRAGTPPVTSRKPEAVRRVRRRTPVLYLAPWIDLGGSDKGTIDWFKHIDRERWAPSIITTQPSPNRWLTKVAPYAEEIWSLPDLMAGSDFASFILGFIESRRVELVHVMNSRIAFDLMPDMTCLAEPPAIVVQLHAEEPDRSGYVRYSASRYGNLVDAFSVTSRQLADAMRDYEVPRSRMHVITTGVDGHEEFDPAHVEPFDDLVGEGPRILWPGRVVAQKDPMLTLDVIKLLDDRGVRFTMDLVGDGDMAEGVRARAQELGIAHRIQWHPPSHEMPRWYRSCDVLLMTSVFEGVPYVMYEAQAMGMPIVVPAIPGNVEFLEGKDGGVLIDPREDAVAYADALQELLQDEPRRRDVGARARERMLRECSLEEMGQRHDELYEQLLDARTAAARSRAVAIAEAGEEPAEEVPPPPPVRFPRDAPRERSIAVIVPCYQHGRFLPDAIRSLHEQTLKPRRIIVVDDASADPETTAALDALERDPLVEVVRLPVNRGPSVARNRALAMIDENYVLPLDADDVMLPRGLEEMVEQLERAPEDVGYIYPNVQHFGNRNDYYEAPAFNLHLLLNENYCAATSMFDRRVFDAGIRYAEEIVYGHEDWDLVLQMAEHEIHGQRAEGATFLYRKGGFSRVNAVEYGPEGFYQRIVRRHPVLYSRRDRIKARWAPALSLVLTGDRDRPGATWPQDVLQRLAAQSCRDFEVILATDVAGDREDVVVVDAEGEGEARDATAIGLARGRWVVLASPDAADAVRRPEFVEQVLRIFWSNAQLDEFAIATTGDPRTVPLSLLHLAGSEAAVVCAAAWRRSPTATGASFELGVDGSPARDLVNHWELERAVQWRGV